MYCKNCGNKLDDNAKFCAICGSKIERITAEQVHTVPDYNNQSANTPSIDNQSVNTSSFNNQSINTQPAVRRHSNPPQQPKGNRGLKITFFSLAALSVILVVVLIAVLLTGMGSHTNVTSVLADEDSDMEFIVSDIDLSDVVAQSGSFAGVWELKGTKADINSQEYTSQPNEDNSHVYIVIDDNNTVQNIQTSNNSVISHEQVNYQNDGAQLISNGYVGALPGSVLIYQMHNGMLVIQGQADGAAITDYMIYEKTNISADELLGNVDIVDTPQSSDNATVSDTGYDIEEQIIGAWEHEYEDKYFGYEFYADGTFRCIEDFYDGDYFNEILSYKIINETQMIVNDNYDIVIDVAVDYEFGEYYLILGVNGEYSELFEVAELRQR